MQGKIQKVGGPAVVSVGLGMNIVGSSLPAWLGWSLIAGGGLIFLSAFVPPKLLQPFLKKKSMNQSSDNHDPNEKSSYSGTNMGGIVTIGQSGGTNTVHNYGAQRVQFSLEIGRQLLDVMPDKNKKVHLQTIGGTRGDQEVGDATQAFLEKNGYSVIRARIGSLMPHPEAPFVFVPKQEMYVVMVAPSGH